MNEEQLLSIATDLHYRIDKIKRNKHIIDQIIKKPDMAMLTASHGDFSLKLEDKYYSLLIDFVSKIREDYDQEIKILLDQTFDNIREELIQNDNKKACKIQAKATSPK
jgi:hypothetical protein